MIKMLAGIHRCVTALRRSRHRTVGGIGLVKTSRWMAASGRHVSTMTGEEDQTRNKHTEHELQRPMLYFMVFHCIVWYCTVWNCMELYEIMGNCMELCGIVW